jgi:hypothetical protein
VKAYVVKITPWFPAEVRLQWDVTEANESGTFTFDVERSGSPAGPWTTLASGVTGVTYTDDLSTEEVNILALTRDLYYRIKVIPPSGAVNAIYTPIVNLDGLVEHDIVESTPGNPARPVPMGQIEPDPQENMTTLPERMNTRLRLFKRKILRDRYIMLRHLNGIEYYLLKRRHFGTRCSHCYDAASGELLYSNCQYCHGTSWVDGGFYDPLLLLGRRLTSQIQTKESPQAKDDVNFTYIQFLDFPRIDEGDILVERVHNRRFIVKQRAEVFLKTITVHQTVTVSELPRTAPEYKVAVSL